MPPHSLLRACSKCTTLLCSEPCHLTVSSSLFEVYDSAVFRAMPPHSLFEPVRLVCPTAFRAMPPHSLLRACSAGVPYGIQSHATSQSLTSLFGWCALRHSEPCHLTVSYEPVRLVCPAAFRAMPPHSLLRACSAGVRLCRVQNHATSQSLTSLFGAAYPPYSTI